MIRRGCGVGNLTAALLTSYDEKNAVKAEVHTMGGSSAHGGQYDLLRWHHAIAGSRVQVALIPGEDRGRNALAEIIRQRHGRRPLLPVQGDAIEL